MNGNKFLSLATYSRIFLSRAGRFGAALLLAAVGSAHGAPGGELDSSFGDNGRLRIHADGDFTYGRTIAQQPVDGKLLITGGYTDTYGGSGLAVRRLNADGSADESFGTNGTVITEFWGPYDLAAELVLQPDGKILIAGSASNVSDFALARLNADGTIDATFGADGLVTLDLGGNYEEIRGISMELDGRLVVTGITNANGFSDIAFARFNGDGSLDTTFGTGRVAGTTLVNASDSKDGRFSNDEPLGITRQLDGKYVACGFADTDYWDYHGSMVAVRIHADGAIDTEFGADGVSRPERWSYAQSCPAMPDGSIVLAGSQVYGGEWDLAFIRLTSDGTKDVTFGNSGLSLIDLGGTDHASAMIRLDDGRLGVTGSIGTVRNNVFGIPTDMFLARIDADSGSLDPTFGENGVTIVDFGIANESAYSVGTRLIQRTDGKLVAAGSAAWPDAVLTRVDPAGGGNAGFAGFAETSARVAEGTDELVIAVRRTGGGTGDLSVDYNTVAGTALAPGDFTTSFGTLTWTSGDMQPKRITVPITDDGAQEANERFSVVLSNSTGGLAASEFVVTVTDNDAPPPPPPASPPKPAAGGGGGTSALEILFLLSLLGSSLNRRSESAGSRGLLD